MSSPLKSIQLSLNDFQLSLDAFEGPLDLLLHLIAKDEVEIFDIPIARVTEQYLVYVKTAEHFDLNIASEFLLMAATLVEIKAAALLPREESEDDEEVPVSPDDARAVLIASLIEYKTYKNVAAEFAARLELEERFYTRHAPRAQAFVVDKNLLENTSAAALAELLAKVIFRGTPKVLSLAHMRGVEYTVEEKIRDIVGYLSENRRGTFRQLAGKAKSKIEKIIILLALLELHKLGRVTLRQATTFGEIEVVQGLDFNNEGIEEL